LSILKKDLKDPSFIKDGKLDAPLLLLGLAYREVSRAMEVEPDAPTKAPSHLVNSPFSFTEVKQIERLINGIVLPSNN
jgi:hypothetical protein